MLAALNASRNRTLPGWQGWMLAPSDASRQGTYRSRAWPRGPPRGCGGRVRGGRAARAGLAGAGPRRHVRGGAGSSENRPIMPERGPYNFWKPQIGLRSLWSVCRSKGFRAQAKTLDARLWMYSGWRYRALCLYRNGHRILSRDYITRLRARRSRSLVKLQGVNPL